MSKIKRLHKSKQKHSWRDAQQLGACNAPPEDLSLIPTTTIRHLTSICNFASTQI